MCIKNEKLTFCTCSEKENKTSANYDAEIYYTWLLTSFKGYRKSRIRGKILMPSKDLGKGLTVTRVLDILNSDSSYFDFDYHPKELDCLHINNNLKHPYYQYFSVIYKNNIWQIGRNPAFVSITETIAQGRISKEVSEPKKASRWLVSQEKLSADQLFDKLLHERNDKKQWRFIRPLVNRFPKETFQKALYLCNANAKNDKIKGFRLLIELYESEYNVEAIKSVLFDTLNSEHDTDLLRMIIFALGSNIDHLSDEDIKNLVALKEKGPDFKIMLIDDLIGADHKLISDLFIELSRDANWGVRKKMIMDLSYHEDLDTAEIRKVFWETIENQNNELRQYAIYGLAVRKDKAIRPILEKELQYMDTNDVLILKAIEELEDLEMIPLLESRLENSENKKQLSDSILKTIQILKINAE